MVACRAGAGFLGDDARQPRWARSCLVRRAGNLAWEGCEKLASWKGSVIMSKWAGHLTEISPGRQVGYEEKARGEAQWDLIDRDMVDVTSRWQDEGETCAVYYVACD